MVFDEVTKSTASIGQAPLLLGNCEQLSATDAWSMYPGRSESSLTLAQGFMRLVTEKERPKCARCAPQNVPMSAEVQSPS